MSDPFAESEDDDDNIDYMTPDEFEDLEQAMRQLAECDLGEWDRDFADDIQRRLYEYGRRTIVTGKQWKQLERMKETYL